MAENAIRLKRSALTVERGRILWEGKTNESRRKKTEVSYRKVGGGQELLKKKGQPVERRARGEKQGELI